MEKTKFYSWKNGELSRGCQFCVKGEKTVLFITGLCHKHCFYCPISDQKSNKDVIFANEIPIQDENGLIQEIELCNSKGVGITGGDPLLRLERTCNFISILKEKFGKQFHIHLYTPLDLVSEEVLNKLYKSGLNEIRFHPNLKDQKDWKKIELVKKFDWKVGIEIPSIPSLSKGVLNLIEYIKDKVDFININELEISDTNSNNLTEQGFIPKDEFSYGVKGSEELALEILKKYPSFNIHYCTTTLKDRVQLANRIKRRAKNIKKDFDIVTEEGMLIRGVIYLEKPSFGYERKLKELNKEKMIIKLKQIKSTLEKELNLKDLFIDEQKYRLLLKKAIVKQFAKKIKKLNLIPAIAEEYPTYDQFEIEIEYL